MPSFKAESRSASKLKVWFCSRIHRSRTWGIDQLRHRVFVPARQPCSLACRYDNPMPELALSPSQGSMNSATARHKTLPTHNTGFYREIIHPGTNPPYSFTRSSWPLLWQLTSDKKKTTKQCYKKLNYGQKLCCGSGIIFPIPDLSMTKEKRGKIIYLILSS